jgi:hypothetical protein
MTLYMHYLSHFMYFFPSKFHLNFSCEKLCTNSLLTIFFYYKVLFSLTNYAGIFTESSNAFDISCTLWLSVHVNMISISRPSVSCHFKAKIMFSCKKTFCSASLSLMWSWPAEKITIQENVSSLQLQHNAWSRYSKTCDERLSEERTPNPDTVNPAMRGPSEERTPVWRGQFG